MQQQLEQYMLANSTITPPPIIDTSSKNTSQNQRRKGPISDGPEGVTKTEKYYKNCDNTCWSHGYDCSKRTIVVIVPTKRQATSTHTRITTRQQEQVSWTRSARNGPDGVDGHSWIVTLQIEEVD